MGGGTTIEATEPVTIPAYTDKEITVVPKGVQGIDYGEVVITENASVITVSHNLGIKPSKVLFLLKSSNQGYSTVMIYQSSTVIQDFGGSKLYGIDAHTGLTQISDSDANRFTTFDDRQIRFTRASGGELFFGTYIWIAIA